MKRKLAIITTHPIQYNAPWFRLLSEQEEIQLKVFYTWSQRQFEFYDANFGKEIKWDIPLLEGYDYEFVENISHKPGNKSFWGIDCPSLINKIRAWNPTHILVFGWNFKAHFSVMRYFKGKIPVLFRGDSTLLDYDIRTVQDFRNAVKRGSLKNSFPQLLRYKIRLLGLKFIYRYIDKALYVGANNKNYFIAHGLKENQLYFVPHAVDNARFKDDILRKYAMDAKNRKKELGITELDFVLLFAGKLETKKNPVILLEAFNKLKSQINQNIKLIYVGNGDIEEKLKKWAMQEKNEKNIIFIPFQNQTVMPVVYRLADVFCLPSSGPGETWGLAVNESIACGTPVIVSSKAGCAIDLATQPPCYQFQSGNVSDLCRAIETAWANRGLVQDETWNARINEWSFEKLIKNLLKVLE
jgi:glycosyltransferase involved in cell wall biosynthesis